MRYRHTLISFETSQNDTSLDATKKLILNSPNKMFHLKTHKKKKKNPTQIRDEIWVDEMMLCSRFV